MSLKDLVERDRPVHVEINERHAKLEKTFRLNVLEAIAIGSLLQEAKAGLKRGEWELYVKKKIRFSLRTVERYMDLSKHQEALGKNDTVSFLSLSHAHKEVAKRKKRAKRIKPVDPAVDENPPEREVDQEGRAIPDTPLRETIEEALFEVRAVMEEFMQDISRMKAGVEALVQEDPFWHQVDLNQWTLQCDNLRGLLRFAAPHAVCPYCKGRGCKACNEQGWVTERLYKTAPEEMRT
jgi:hypothetical protein